MLKKILLGVLAAFLVLQFVRPEKNLSAQPPGPDDFIVRQSPPVPIAHALRTACYDCHSNHTRYPWYAELQPLGWWLARHIEDGKAELNFSTFGAYPPRTQARKLSAISDQITTGKMPLPSYTWGHRDARLTEAQIEEISVWVDELYDALAP